MAPGGYRSFVFLRSKGEEEATVRLQSGPLARQLASLPDVKVEVIAPDARTRLVLGEATCIVLHYNDPAAVAAVRVMQRGPHRALVVCLGCDLYDLADYTSLNDVADVFTMPTDLHRGVLAGQIYKPVHLLPEGVDPAAFDAAAQTPPCFPPRAGRRALWFGYAESFEKGMSPLVPVIQDSIARGGLEDFTVMLNQAAFDNRHRLPTLAYDHRTFGAQAAAFDYAILSHLPSDLRVNSLIKSPNKAVTALLAGLIPIASDTPSYRALFERHGLSRFLFASPGELHRMLARLDPVADSAAIQASGVIPALLAEGSSQRLQESFLALLDDPNVGGLEGVRFTPFREPPALGLRAHLVDLLPSAVRSLRRRLKRHGRPRLLG